jgi:uncharacterized membrane protein
MLANLFQTESNPVSATKSLIRQLGIKVSNSAIKTQIDNHPDYPSILSISDSLKQWKVDNFAIQAKKEKLNELPLPFIAHLKKQGGSFITVINITDTGVIYKNDSGGEAHKPIADFLQEWSGVTLLAEPGEHAGEKNYKESRKKEILHSLKLPLVIAIVLSFSAFALIYQYNTLYSFAYCLLLILNLSGCAIAALLLWYEIDKANPVLKQICRLGRQTNCSAVLNSKQAKLFNVISWSEVGFFYFAGGFISLLVAGTQATALLQLLAWLNLLALPYTIFSVYYQWKVAKQWCPMCLAIQAIIITEFITAITSGIFLLQAVEFSLLNILAPSYLLPAITWFLLKPLLLQSQEAKRIKKELLKFKFNHKIFDTLLQKEKHLAADPSGLGITLGNPNAKNTIIKVCNPYCGPCAKAHPEIDEMLEKNKDLKVQILFTATNDEKDKANKPVKHLLAVAAKQNEQETKYALNDWYLAGKKDYGAFALKYPMNGEITQQDYKVEAMSKWCKEIGIAFTPTFFINGNQMPDVYNIQDLNYFLQLSE